MKGWCPDRLDDSTILFCGGVEPPFCCAECAVCCISSEAFARFPASTVNASEHIGWSRRSRTFLPLELSEKPVYCWPGFRYRNTPLTLCGGEPGTRTLNAVKHNGFRNRPTTNYHNSPKYPQLHRSIRTGRKLAQYWYCPKKRVCPFTQLLTVTSMADGVGFEPTRLSSNGFQDRRHKPDSANHPY